MKKTYFQLSLALFGIFSLTCYAKASDEAKTTAPSKKSAKKSKTAAEIAEEARLGVRKVGIQVGSAVDDFLKKKPSKKEKAAKK